MDTEEFNEDFSAELEKRIDVLTRSDSDVKRLGTVDYTFTGLFIVLSFVLLIWGWFA